MLFRITPIGMYNSNASKGFQLVLNNNLRLLHLSVVIIKEHRPEWTTSDDTPSNTLVIIDGVPHAEKGAMAGLDPDDITSMEVIKDKTKMKKYSDKDYDGMILITTKKGKQ